MLDSQTILTICFLILVTVAWIKLYPKAARFLDQKIDSIKTELVNAEQQSTAASQKLTEEKKRLETLKSSAENALVLARARCRELQNEGEEKIDQLIKHFSTMTAKAKQRLENDAEIVLQKRLIALLELEIATEAKSLSINQKNQINKKMLEKYQILQS